MTKSSELPDGYTLLQWSSRQLMTGSVLVKRGIAGPGDEPRLFIMARSTLLDRGRVVELRDVLTAWLAENEAQ